MYEPLPEPLLDFRNMMHYVWTRLPQIARAPTPLQYDIAHYIQYGPLNKGIEAFRGAAKTYITALYAVWRLRQDPNIKVLVISASMKHARSVTSFCKQLINEIDVFRCMRGVRGDGDRDSMEEFDVRGTPPDPQPSFRALGITSQLPGNRADVIIFDDVEVPDNSDTEGKREHLREKVKEGESIIKPLPTSQIIFLGTPQSILSVYNDLGEHYKFRVWPVRFPEDPTIYKGNLAPFLSQAMADDPTLAGTPTEPSRFNEEYLLEKEASVGRSYFRLQFMLDTELSDRERYPLRLPDLVVTDVDDDVAPQRIVYGSTTDLALDLQCPGFNGDRFYRPRYLDPVMLPYQRKLMVIDPSGRGADETGYCILGVLNSHIYVLDWGGLAGGYDDPVLEYLAKLAGTHRVSELHTESNFGQGMFMQLLRPYLLKYAPALAKREGDREQFSVGVKEIRSSIQKEKRICDTLEPVLNQHRLVMSKRLIEKDRTTAKDHEGDRWVYYQGLFQMAHMTREKGALVHDDRLDVLAMAVALVSAHMALDADAEARFREEQEHLAHLERIQLAWEVNGGIMPDDGGCLNPSWAL